MTILNRVAPGADRIAVGLGLTDRLPVRGALQHGKVLEEYVEVPDSLLRNVDELEHHFRTSYAYVSSLKPKRTTRPTKTSGSA